MLFSREQRDEEVLATVIAHYFTPDERTRAETLAQTESYEAAIAYLAQAGAHSLRDSGEEHPPRIYITIPGGQVLIHHPARLFPAPTLYAMSVAHLAMRAFPPPVAEHASGHEATPVCAAKPDPPPASNVTRSRKKPVQPRPCAFLEQAVRIGTKRHFWTRQGWVVKKGFLGYVLTKLPSGSYRVELVHLVSYWVLAAIYVEVDETTHERLQSWVRDVHALTDWSRGISAILKEKPGEQKKWAWTKQLEDLWQSRRQQLRQLSFF